MERGKRPTISQVAEVTDLGFVAERGGQVCGFIVARQPRVSKRALGVGEIMILGVHPEHRRKGVARELVDAICGQFRSRGIRTVRIGIDPHDQDLLSFFESMDFAGESLLNYTKTL